MDSRFRAGARAIAEAADGVWKRRAGSEDRLIEALAAHLQVVSRFAGLPPNQEMVRDRLVQNCLDWQQDVRRRDLVNDIVVSARWFAGRSQPDAGRESDNGSSSSR